MEEAQDDFHASQKVDEGCPAAEYLRNLYVETLQAALRRLHLIPKIILQQDHYLQRTNAGAVLIRLRRQSNRNDDRNHPFKFKDAGGQWWAVSSFFPN